MRICTPSRDFLYIHKSKIGETFELSLNNLICGLIINLVYNAVDLGLDIALSLCLIVSSGVLSGVLGLLHLLHFLTSHMTPWWFRSVYTIIVFDENTL